METLLLLQGGSASRTGWILCLGSHALTWGSQRQTLVALSTCEAELIAATSAVLAAQPMLLLLEEVQREVRAELRCDNAAAIAIMRKEELSLRTRHLSIRAEYLRSLPANISVSYTPTGEQKADILTKGLAREVHKKACQAIGMQGVNADHPSLTPSLSERSGDATRQCLEFAQPGMASLELVQDVSGRRFWKDSFVQRTLFGEFRWENFRGFRWEELSGIPREQLLGTIPLRELLRQFCLENFLFLLLLRLWQQSMQTSDKSKPPS